MSIHTIYLDGEFHGYWVRQEATHTKVWDRKAGAEVKMPEQRYSLACDHPNTGVPGRAEFFKDLRATRENQP